MNSSIDAEKYWTGIADVTSEELPAGVKGSVFRVLTFAEDFEEFVQKVSEVLHNAGDTLAFLEEPEPLSDFLGHEWVGKDHEIFEMMISAERSCDDVVCGEPEYYSYNDA